MLTPHTPAESTASWNRDARSTQASMSNGSTDTDMMEFAVIATGSPSRTVVSTVTPVG